MDQAPVPAPVAGEADHGESADERGDDGADRSPDRSSGVGRGGARHERVDDREPGGHCHEGQDQHHAPADQRAAKERAPVQTQWTVKARVGLARSAGRALRTIVGGHLFS